ncbi:hypothetical protein PUMCH_002666 [Australozyma saopauloensis]|uniref:B30.2/SPRY domain-containing protein n=1 Tax=Australozyma saopauloensis TaxID=291208 RepID=A0AAX4HAC0_9ASCO|nr:hypothetical protein PUMCH_002666 [[Candida] saopauloensis]
MEPDSLLVLLSGVSLLIFVVIALVVLQLILPNRDGEYRPLLNSVFNSGDVDRNFLNDEESLMQLAEEFDYGTLSPEEQRAFLEGEEFLNNNPPNPEHVRGRSYTREDELLIKDCGINAFEFEQEKEILAARYIVEDRTEVNFLNNEALYSTATAVLNHSLPSKNRSPDTIYFEVKIFEFPEDSPNAHFALGLVTKPYPSTFRLPGYNNFSLAYESTGNLKINKPFPTPLQQHRGEQSQFNAQVLPPLSQSDIVGFGYMVSSGTIFITRNGKKIMDVMKGCYLDMFPAIGCFSCNAKFQANFGQMGFVWIEANVRKYGFFSTGDRRLTGQRGLAFLPEYGNSTLQKDKLLGKGDDLPPEYPEHEYDFFGRRVVEGTSAQLQSTKKYEQSEYEDKD